jgi:aspartyl-tRNA(Asn)/glutamyl-tRNA(Gln) amidotransferase subunit A
MHLHTLSVHRLGELLGRREVSSEEVTRACLERISQVEDKIKAFITVIEEEALALARAVDEQRVRGEELSPLAGIPVAIADNICTEGVRTTCASKMLENFIPPYNAAVAERLKKAGSVLVGKCNLDEFAMGSSTGNSCFFSTGNPFDPEAVPGGSSGGAAAAVAAGEAAFALGSDTGGSIRQPAAFCGVVGLKPTYGYVSRFGLISHASSLDQIGPFTRDVTDLALVLNIICGRDDRDSTSAPVDVPDFRKYLVNDVKGLKIGLPGEYYGTDPAPRVAARLREAVRKLEELGAVCEEVSMPHTEYALPAHYIISSAEASSNLARYDGVRYGLREDAEDVLGMFQRTRGRGFGAEVKKRIMLGTYALSAGNYNDYYVKALKFRTLIKQDFARAFEKFDCLLTPTVPATAFKKGEMRDDPLAGYQSHVFTIPANLAGLPAMSLPFGLVEGLPVGLQLIARHFDEGALLRAGYALEQSSEQTGPKPDLFR